MALYRTVSPAEATGKVKEVYDDIMATKKIEFIPNFWLALSNNPDHLEATWQKLKTDETRQARSADQGNYRPGGFHFQQLQLLN